MPTVARRRVPYSPRWVPGRSHSCNKVFLHFTAQEKSITIFEYYGPLNQTCNPNHLASHSFNKTKFNCFDFTHEMNGLLRSSSTIEPWIKSETQINYLQNTIIKRKTHLCGDSKGGRLASNSATYRLQMGIDCDPPYPTVYRTLTHTLFPDWYPQLTFWSVWGGLRDWWQRTLDGPVDPPESRGRHDGAAKEEGYVQVESQKDMLYFAWRSIEAIKYFRC